MIKAIVYVGIALGITCFGLNRLYEHYGTFENQRYVGDLKRIPLWYPYELVDWGKGVGGVRLVDWNDRCRPVSLEGAVSAEEIAMASLDDIIEFGYDAKTLWGRRMVCDSERCYGERYFVYEINMTAPAYFSKKSEYVALCAAKGVDPEALDIFEERWKAHWGKRGCRRNLK